MKGKVFFRQRLIWVMILLGQLHGYRSCIEKERMALLELKKYINSITEEKVPIDYVLPTWTNDTTSRCCWWEGVKCNRTSRRVTEISFGEQALRENSLLNISLLHPFEEVRMLDLSASGFNGLFDHVEGYKSLKKLKNLEILNLSRNSFNNSIFLFLNAATPLTSLYLRNNNMGGSLPAKELKDLTNLEVLDLTGNRFIGSIPLELYSLRNLKVLGLSSNGSPGSMMQGICKLKNLQELGFSQNNLVGQFPLCLTSLTRLRVLDLSSNQLSGELPSALGNLKSLEYLSLLDNNFQGFISLDWLANLSEMKVFKLDSKSNSIQVVSESSWKPTFQLSVITLQSCKLEKLPHFLLHQKDLRHVDLSHNNISENFPYWMLANNSKLEVLLLQDNSFTSFKLTKSARYNLHSFDVSMNELSNVCPENIGWILPHVQYMNLSNNGFDGHLPSSLGNMKELKYLDISHNNFSGTLPRSFLNGCYSIKILLLSHNKLCGDVFQESVNFTNIEALTMNNNQFSGKIGQGLRSLKYLMLLDISNNNITGVIPSWLGEELQALYALLLSNNSLEGEIPISLFRKLDIELLDLSANKLSGRIPSHVNSTRPVVLLLQDNNFSGDVPDTLLVNVTVLDLRNNRLSGSIPSFINTENIRILLLRGNNLTGGIPHGLCALKKIHLLDLANNILKGSIPPCLSNLSFGLEEVYRTDAYGFFVGLSYTPLKKANTNSIGVYFTSMLVLEEFGTSCVAGGQTKIEFPTKHRYDAYVGRNLLDLAGLDLSQNELSGEVPTKLGGLVELHALNLSHNKLSGVIPRSFSGLKKVESLDLSSNRLQGEIPSQLAELSSLAVFNVSYNNISGVIPQGRQFNTFDMRSYLGNPLLCGLPTNISCNNGNDFQEPDNSEVESDESTIDMVSFYWSLDVAYVTLLLGILASISFDSSWSRAWFYIVDAFIQKLRNFLW